MPKVAATLIKMVVLFGGAVAGALAARWLEELLMEQERAQSEEDRTRYERGLSPLEPLPKAQEEQ